MKPEFLEHRNCLDECPQCGKHSLAQRSHDQYQCLWCGFYRDMSQSQGVGMLFWAAIFVAVLGMAFATQIDGQAPTLSPSDSSGVPAKVVGD